VRILPDTTPIRRDRTSPDDVYPDVVSADPLADELAPYLDVWRRGLRVGDAVAGLGAGERTALRRVALLMFRSDAVRAGSVLRVLDFLADEHGVVPLRLAVRRIDGRAFDRQYVTELPIISTGLWLHHRVATAGGAVFVVVTGPSPAEGSLATALDELKGASSPAAETGTATLRARFGRPSSFHVVLHTSEDAGDFLQGAADVFGWATVRAVLGEVAAGNGRRIDRGRLDVLLGELAPPPGRDVFDLALGLERRIVAALGLAADEPEHPVDLSPARGLLAELDRLYATTDLGAGASFAARRERFMAMAHHQRAPLHTLIGILATAASSPPPPEDPSGTVGEAWRRSEARELPVRLARAAWFLSGQEAYDLDDGTALIAALEQAGILLGPGEDTVLAAGLACDLNPVSTFAGRRTYPYDPA